MVDARLKGEPAAAPIACTLDGSAYKHRMEEIRAFFGRALKTSHREGAQLHLTFDATAGPEVEDFVRKEKACCAFLDFQIADGDGIVNLTITIPPNAIDAADDLFEPFNSACSNTACGCIAEPPQV